VLKNLHTPKRKEQLEQRLVAVSFMPGNQGSFVTHLINLSPEVAKHRLATGDFSDGTAHWGNEQWLAHCHHWDHARLIDHDYFYNNLTDLTIDYIDNHQGFMPFRCHPAVAMAVQSLLPQLKIVQITHPDPYHSYRLYWEKLILGFNQEQDWYVDSYYRITGIRPKYLTPQMKRQLLIGWFNHYHDRTINRAYQFNLVDFWYQPRAKYLDLTSYLGITPCDSRLFDAITQDYRSKQWNRF
jgi:hypothetical protein